MEEIQKMKTPEQIGCNMTHEIGEKRKKITEQEVLEKWEKRGFEIENNDKRICFENKKLNIVIYMEKISKNIQICVCHYNYAQTISFELHNLIHKTIKTLEEEE